MLNCEFRGTFIIPTICSSLNKVIIISHLIGSRLFAIQFETWSKFCTRLSDWLIVVGGLVGVSVYSAVQGLI